MKIIDAPQILISDFLVPNIYLYKFVSHTEKESTTAMKVGRAATNNRLNKLITSIAALLLLLVTYLLTPSFLAKCDGVHLD
jgi:hypothetical protein